MPRNLSGVYTLPAGNPVVPGTTIDANWANSTLSDMANEITNSLSRTGAGGMLAPFRIDDGNVTGPGLAFLNETNTGYYRLAAGSTAFSVLGVNTLQMNTTSVTVPSNRTLNAQGNALVGGTFGVTGASAFGSTLAVTGAITAVGGVLGNITAASGTSTFADVVITGSLDMTVGSSATITGLSTPVNASDAANKSYVDTQVATRLALAGGTMSGAIAMSTNKITGLGTPTADTDAATKAYVDSVAQGLDVKGSVRAATTGNITLSGAQTIDGVAVIAGDRVLVKDQSTAANNGIYVAAAGAWSRAADADTWNELVGAFVFVEDGTTNDNSGWVCTSPPGGTLGVTAVTFEQFSGAGQINAGTGMTKNGNTLNVNTASSSRIVVGADEIDLAQTGVTAGTYKSVTVDLYGRVTAGTNPTTLAGYGISDAYTQTQTDSLLAQRLALTGGTMTGAIAMSTNRITGMGDPVNAQDAATKNYIDTIFGSTTTAAASAAAAAASASAASTSASNASTSASNAASSASAASTSASNAATSLFNFRAQYLGPLASDPTVDGNGNAVTAGDLYWNTTVNETRIYNGTSWVAAYLPAAGYMDLTTNQTAAGVKTFSSNPILSGGTANGVAYLNGSKVLTTGSALVFDGTNFGVGTSTPGSLTGGASTGVAFNGSSSVELDLTTAGVRRGYFYADSNAAEIGTVTGSIPIKFSIGLSEQMRLTSTGLGIGTSSPGYKVAAVVTGGADAFFADGNGQSYSGYRIRAGAGGQQWAFRGGTSTMALTDVTAGTDRMQIDTSGNLGLGVTPSTILDIGANNNTPKTISLRYSTVPAYLSNSFDGSVGLTTLSTNSFNTSNGSASWSAFQNTGYGNAAVQIATATTGADVRFLTAAAANTNPTERFRIGPAGQIGLGGANYGTSGQVLTSNGSGSAPTWQNAGGGGSPGGSSGQVQFNNSGAFGGSSNFNWDTSSNIRLGLGTSTFTNISATVATLSLGGTNVSTSGGIAYQVNGTAKALHYVDGDLIYHQGLTNVGQVFWTNNTERARITSGGNFLVGTTASTFGFNSAVFASGSANAGVTVFGTGQTTYAFATATSGADSYRGYIQYTGGGTDSMAFGTASTERARITGSGALLVGTTTATLNSLTSQVAVNLGNSTGDPNAGINVRRGYSVHPGRTSNYYGVYAQLDGSDQDGSFTTGAVCGFANIQGGAGVLGLGGYVTGAGYGVVGLVQANTDGYGYGYSVTAKWKQAGGTGSNAGWVGFLAEDPNYLSTGQNTIGFYWNSLYTGGANRTIAAFVRNGTTVGSITCSTSTTAYNTSSDYRLKDNPQPLTGSGAFIDALQPKTWSWKIDGSRGVGFIAHEVQPISPSSVSGEKDAVDYEGKPIMQAMEYGSAEFIANIIAELQSLRARVAQLEAK